MRQLFRYNNKVRRCLGQSLLWLLPISLLTNCPLARSQNVSEKPTFEARTEQLWKLVDKNEKVEKVAGGFGFTEGPVWDPKGFLYVSDEEKNKLSRVYPDGRVETVLEIADPDGSTLDSKGRLVTTASVLRAIIRVDADGKYTVLADKFEGKRFNSPNDIILGPDGALYFTDPTLDLVKGERQ